GRRPVPPRASPTVRVSCAHENTGGGPGRPTIVLTCYRTRKRIGAYLDGALEGPRAESAARHLAACTACQREADGLRKIRAMLQQALGPAGRVPEPDWTGFWPGIVRGIEQGKHRAPVRSEEHTSELQSRGHLVCRL